MRVPLTKELRAKIFERDDFTCQYCGRSAPDVVLEIDHVIPISKGGTNDESNLVTSCKVCNVRKRDYDCTDELKQRLKETAENSSMHFSRTEIREKPSEKNILAMKDFVVYPAVFEWSNDGSVAVEFPDFKGCISGGYDTERAVYMARDALELRLWSDLCDNIPFPAPSDPVRLKETLTASQTVQLIDVDMKLLRAKFSGKSANKMVTLPQWLIHRGKLAGLNFSQVLQKALMQELGIKDSPKH